MRHAKTEAIYVYGSTLLDDDKKKVINIFFETNFST